MKAFLDICASALNRIHLSSFQDHGGVERTSAERRDFLPSERMEFAMGGMSDEDARWYYERLRWRA